MKGKAAEVTMNPTRWKAILPTRGFDKNDAGCAATAKFRGDGDRREQYSQPREAGHPHQSANANKHGDRANVESEVEQ